MTKAVPLPLRPEDDLDDFADGTAAARGARDDVGGLADLGDGVGRAGGQPDGPEHRQVGQVVADVADLPRLQAQPPDQVAERPGLGVVALEDMRDRQLGGPPLDGRARRPERMADRFPARCHRA